MLINDYAELADYIKEKKTDALLVCSCGDIDKIRSIISKNIPKECNITCVTFDEYKELVGDGELPIPTFLSMHEDIQIPDFDELNERLNAQMQDYSTESVIKKEKQKLKKRQRETEKWARRYYKNK